MITLYIVFKHTNSHFDQCQIIHSCQLSAIYLYEMDGVPSLLLVIFCGFFRGTGHEFDTFLNEEDC